MIVFFVFVRFGCLCVVLCVCEFVSLRACVSHIGPISIILVACGVWLVACTFGYGCGFWFWLVVVACGLWFVVVTVAVAAACGLWMWLWLWLVVMSVAVVAA